MRSAPLLFSAVLGFAFANGCGSTSSKTDGGGGAAGAGTGGQAGGHDDAATDAPGHDGAGGIGGPCWTEADCTLDGVCAAPGQVICGGICAYVTQPCQADSDCAGFDAATSAPLVCDPTPCTSCNSTNACHPGCASDADCAPGTSCGSNQRCAPSTCTSASGSCPVDFVCGADGHCARKPCTTDAECSKACVLGACYDSPGVCHVDEA